MGNVQWLMSLSHTIRMLKQSKVEMTYSGTMILPTGIEAG